MMGFLNRLLDWMIANDLTASEIILNSLLVMAGLAIAVSLYRMHYGNGTYQNFNLVHLIVNAKGYPDGAKCVEIGTFILLSWGFIVYVTAKTLPEWYMQWFLFAFVLRGAYGAYLRSKGEPPAEPGTVTDTNVHTRVVKGAKPKVDEPT